MQTLKGLSRCAEFFGTELVAEGIEAEGELQVLRDPDIELGQGRLLGRPAAVPADAVPPHRPSRPFHVVGLTFTPMESRRCCAGQSRA